MKAFAVLESTVVRGSPEALPRSVRVPLACVAVVGALVVLVQALAYAGHTTGEWVAPRPWLSGFPWYFATVVDFLGEPLGAVLLMLVLIPLCWFTGHRRTAVSLPLAAAVAVGATTLLKPLVDREIHGGYLSFPSGHTAYATTVAMVLSLMLVRRFGRITGVLLVLGIALVAGALMGWTEVALSAHYPTDTVGGFATAAAVVPLVTFAVDAGWARFSKPRPS